MKEVIIYGYIIRNSVDSLNLYVAREPLREKEIFDIWQTSDPIALDPAMFSDIASNDYPRKVEITIKIKE